MDINIKNHSHNTRSIITNTASNATSFHLPAEIVDLIVAELKDDLASIRNLRLVNRLLKRCATPYICDLWRSPAELFEVPDDSEEYYWPVPEERRRCAGPDLTTWTWIDVPENVKIEDETTPEGERMKVLMWAPKALPLYAGQFVRPLQEGRVGFCWGRLIEQPGTVCLVQKWESPQVWKAYRSSQFARDIKQFLEEIAPGCVASSRSEIMVLDTLRNSNPPLFEGYCEVRTLHFDPNMTREQQKIFERSLRSNVISIGVRDIPDRIGPARWCWLPGLRMLNGRRTVAARFVFSWGSPETKAVHKKVMEERDDEGNDWNLFQVVNGVVDICKIQLENAGFIEASSLHCRFQAGPRH